jgi:hypothetical protein
MDVENLLVKASDTVSVRRAFGPAYEKDGMLIIPVAIVVGGGAGRPRRGNSAARSGGPPEEGHVAHDTVPADTGRMDSGGGLGGLVLPSGAYVVKGDQVRWVPAVDTTIVVLASLGLVRALARAWTGRPGRPR